MIIETRNLIIRSLKPDDGSTFAEMAADGSLRDVGFDADCSDWMGEWIKEAIKLSDADNPRNEYIANAVCIKETKEVIGSVGCSFYYDLDEVGVTYFIGEKYRGNGYATECVKAYTDYFFEHYKINKIISTVREANVASWKTMEKCHYLLVDTRMYKDINDETEQLYRFYEKKKVQNSDFSKEGILNEDNCSKRKQRRL